jgi:hypothetical protein
MRALILISLLIYGCSSTPTIEYQAVPIWLIPAQPDIPKIQSADLKCLSDETYYSLVVRDRALRYYSAELRALLEAK